VGVFVFMNSTLFGLREGALTITYNAIMIARGAMRRAMRPAEVGVRVVLSSGDGTALVRHRGGRRPWALPGGGVGRGETLTAAALREVREEAGCEAQLEGMLGLYHSFAGGMSNYIAVFVCSALGEVRAPRGDLEIVDARLFQRRDLPEGAEAGSLRRIDEYWSGRSGIYGPW
jgi:8-oxo-dGTP diphosphatase